MNHFEAYLVELLQHHIVFGGAEVPVRRQFSERGQAPCITLDTGSIGTGKLFRETNAEDGEVVVTERVCTLYINLWCNTEAERESISSQILTAFMDEQTGHYKYCSRYNDEMCTSGGLCLARQSADARAVKNQCPQPRERGYESLSTKHGLIMGSVNIEPPVMMDEVKEYPPLLRNRFDCEASYYDVYTLGGEQVEEFNFNVIER